jgi:hypothetical protein
MLGGREALLFALSLSSLVSRSLLLAGVRGLDSSFLLLREVARGLYRRVEKNLRKKSVRGGVLAGRDGPCVRRGRGGAPWACQ